MLLEAAAEVAPQVASNWPGAVQSIVIALLTASPMLIAAYAAYRATVNSNNKVEAKAAQIEQKANEISTKVEGTQQQLDAAEQKRTAVHTEFSQKLDENKTATQDLVPSLIKEINDRIERHKANNVKQLDLLRAEVNQQILTIDAKIAMLQRLVAATSAPPQPQPPPHGTPPS